jgi:hypothetical protein
MNEVELIRAQLSTERQHAAEVGNACAKALGTPGIHGARGGTGLDEFRQACVDYLVWVLARFEEREQTLLDLVRSRADVGADTRHALEEIISRPGKSREALSRLEAALSSNGRGEESARNMWRAFASFFNGDWRIRRGAVDAFFERQARVAEWRAVSAIDADSILEERHRYARVRETLPDGVELQASIGTP